MEIFINHIAEGIDIQFEGIVSLSIEQFRDIAIASTNTLNGGATLMAWDVKAVTKPDKIIPNGVSLAVQRCYSCHSVWLAEWSYKMPASWY